MTGKKINLIFIVITILMYWGVSYAKRGDAEDDRAKSMKISEFLEYCGVPGTCGKSMPCEGTTVEIQGRIDYNNVLDHQRYPQLPYEKFVLLGKNEGERVEVWAIAADNQPIFEKIRLHKFSGATAVVKGVVRGHDLPIMGKCIRWVSIGVDNVDSISFK